MNPGARMPRRVAEKLTRVLALPSSVLAFPICRELQQKAFSTGVQIVDIVILSFLTMSFSP
jgi:hypothetical protein